MNNKQSSVSKLIAEIQRRVAIIQSEPQTMARELMIDNLSVDLEQYEAMHKEEMAYCHIDGTEYAIDIMKEKTKSTSTERFEHYYNETYGGNK